MCRSNDLCIWSIGNFYSVELAAKYPVLIILFGHRSECKVHCLSNGLHWVNWLYDKDNNKLQMWPV